MKKKLLSVWGCLAAASAVAETSLLSDFVQGTAAESSPVRLEARTNTVVAATVVAGKVTIPSPDGVSSKEWDTSSVANGWNEVTDGGRKESLLVLNPPDYAVEGGRITANTTWKSDAVHWVRNWVVVPSGVTLTVKEGTIVKFGEQTGIKVENGGTVDFQGKSSSRIVLTHFADDVYGGDSDFGKTNAWYGAWSLTVVSGGTINDAYTHVRYGKIESLPTISMPASVTAQRIEGKARIPVTLSGTRSNRMSIHWRTIDGTAKFGTDFTKNEDEAIWSNTSSQTVYFEIPLVKTFDDDEVKTFRIEVVSTEDVNPNPERLVTTVTIINGTSVPIAKCAESESSAAVRLENRSTNTVGRALVRGTEWKAASPAEAAAAWDTTKEPEGWKMLTATSGEPPETANVLVRNAAGIAFEGGRLEANTKWTSNAVHVVRNMVVVPNGVTLTVGEGAVVKFAEYTGIKVEDGGKLSLEGKDKARSVLTSLADDQFGGDTDMVETNGVYGSWSVETVGSGSVSDVYTYIRYGTIAALPTISMPVSATAQRSDGKVRIPVTFSGTRANRVSIHWRTNDGTAKHGVDFPQNEGEAVWANTSTTTVFLEIPITTECDTEEIRSFQVELVSAEDINVNPTRLVTTVTIVSGSIVPIPKCASSASSVAVRLDARSADTLGYAAAVGTEWKSADGESRAELWDTTPLGYCWQTLDDGHGANAQVLALNDAKISVEGGRMEASEVWTSNVLHVVRNTVVVPSGITLTVVTNAVVKFCENTGVKVEAGGSLIVAGSTDEPAVFTTLADDTVDGDTDKRETAVLDGQYAIEVVSGGTFSDSNAAFRHVVISSHATLSLPNKCEINESEKQVQIPISLSGSRSTPFRAYWRVLDGSATYPDDYPTRSGVVEWSSSSDGTRFITVPVNDDGVEEEAENFTVELYDAQGANISATAYSCVVTVRDSTATAVPYPTCAESEESEPIRLENRPEGTLGKAVVRGVEYKAAGTDVAATAWDTNAEPEGWKTLTASDAPEKTAQVLVRNDAAIAVEGGRLGASTVWDSNTVHLVRNTVVVPSGVTLSVTTNAVVKFCENTGVKVEAGGRFELLGSLDENVYMTLANDDTVGGDTDKDEDREWAEGAATYSISVVSGGTFTDMNSVIRGTTVGLFGYASVNAKTVVDATEGKIRIPVFVNGSRTTQFSVDWKTSDGLTGQLIWGKASEGTKWVTLDVADCSEKFSFELCESRGINIDGAAKASEVTVFRNTTPLAVCAESESSAAVRFENREGDTFGKALCFGTEWKSAGGETRAVEWDTTKTADGWQDGLMVLNDPSVAVEGGRLFPSYEVVTTNGVDVTNWNYSVSWTSDKVHVVRNWVVVPGGMTLSIAAGTVVKFAEFTGFKVESGGRLSVGGTVDAPVVYTAVADDTIGGDTDRREQEPQYGDYSINIISGGTYSDKNCAVRYATFSNLGTATLPAAAVANEKDEVVRVPLFISTSRTTAFCVDWRVASGAYATNGRLNWNTYTEGTKYIEIPLTPGTVTGEFDTFEIELYESQGINVSTTQRKCVVTVYPDKKFPDNIAFADSDESAAVRLENRDQFWSYGAGIVCGTEWKSVNGDSRAEPWDTTQENDGWVEVDGETTLQLLVRNDESVAVEGGRLEGNTTWSKDKVHIVRNWVVVPNGVTLTIAAGTVVKLCDETGIKVESGGRLVSAGTASADVILTSINDDTVGGDTDFDDVEAEHGGYRISVISGGTFTDTYTQMRYGESGTFGSVSIASHVVAKKDGGVARIPVTISTSRNTPFYVDWVVYDGTAVYGLDYLCASGRITWASSSQGTKYLEIPLDRLTPTEEEEWFEIELTAGLGINLNLNATLCEVDLYDTKDVLVGDNMGYAESEWCEFASVDSSAGTGPTFAMEEVPIRYSTRWVDNGAGLTLSVTDAEKKSAILHQEETAAEGSTTWNGADYEDGRYDLTHKILDADGHAVKIDSATFIVNRDVVQHAGRLSTNETWSADKVHLVVATVTVPNGVTLTIAPDAIVKFMPGASIVVEQGGLGVCKGAVLTHAYDDVMGGDTFFDGAETVPEDGGYSLSGDWEDDESTKYRYSMPLEVSGTLRGENRWPGHKTYIVTGNLTLASGATLTIDAGAVVKFKPGLSFTVNSGATLNAQGTRSSPVVFTSFKDDSHGGDTNGDGNNSVAQGGDWRYVWVYGAANLEYAQILYGGMADGSYGERGPLMTGGSGSLNMNGCLVAHSLYDGIWNWGGTIVAKNCVITDTGWATAPYNGSRNEYINCIFYDNDVGMCYWSHWSGRPVYRNCIFAECGMGWCELNSNSYGDPPSGVTVSNSLFWNSPDGGAQSCGLAGKSGNIWGDPKFENAEKGDYRIKADSPCVDAGDGTVAPARDYYNQPRQTIQTVTPTGTPDATGAYADIGVYEVQPRIVLSDIDLEVKSVMVPETLTVGELVTISWREANIGSVDTDGKWYDKVELVSANGAVVTLGTVPVAGIVAGGEKTITEASFRVPAVAEGTCAIRVTANYQRDIYEGSLTANNVCLSGDTTVSVSGVDFSEDTVAKVRLLQGQQVSYKLTGMPTGGGSLLIHSASGESFGAYVAFGKMPTTYASASSYVVLPNGDVLVSIPPHTDGDATYLMLDSKDKVQNGSLDVTVSENYPAIYALSKESMPNTGSQSLTIYGVGMDEVTRVALVATDGSEIVGTSQRAVNACELSASFALTGAKTGAYRAAVTTKDGKQAVSSSVVSVIPHENAKANLEISLDTPSAIRQNRWYEAVVTVKNAGDADAAVPIVVVNGDGLVFRDPDGGVESYENIIHVLAMGSAANPLILEAGQEIVIHLPFKTVSNMRELDIYYKLLERQDADWESLISQGDMDDASWAAYKDEYQSGYSDVQEFLGVVLAKAAIIASDNYKPCNAFRIYDLIQKEKKGANCGVVRGVVFDDDRQPAGGISVGICSAVDDIVAYGVTDANGLFTVYGVSTGTLAFVSEKVNLMPDQMYTLDSLYLSGVVLTVGHECQMEESAEENFLHYDNFTLLPLSPQCACWATDGTLKAGALFDGAVPKTLIENGTFYSLRTERLGENECVVSGIVSDGGSNRIFVCALRVSDGDIEIGRIDFVDDNVDGIASMYREGSTVRLIYHKCDEGGFKGWCVVDISKKLEFYEQTKSSPKVMRAGAKATEMNLDIPDHPALAACGLYIKDVGVGVGGRLDLHTSGIKENGCCKWVLSYNQKATGSLSASFKKYGGALKGSISEKADESYYCARKFAEQNDCKEENKRLVASKKTKEWRVQLEYTHSFLSTSDIVNSGYIKGKTYEWLANSPISLEVKGTITGTIGGDTTIVTRNYPQMASYYERTDTFGVELSGKLSIEAGLKWDFLEKQEHRSWQQNRDWSVDTGLKLSGEGKFSMALQASRHSFGGESYWSDALGTVTLEARCKAAHVTGKLINDMGNYRWKYDIDLLFWEKSDEGDVFKARAKRALLGQSENNVLLEDNVSSGKITLQSWDFYQVGPSEYVYCKEYISENRVRSGLFYRSYSSPDDIMISELSEDVVHIKPLLFASGKIAVLSLCCKPDFSVGGVELLASYSDRNLYCYWCEDGNWEKIKVFNDENYCDLNFDCSCDGDIGAIVSSRKKRDNGNMEIVITGCMIDGSNRAFDCMENLYSNSSEDVQLAGASACVLNGIPIVSTVMNFGSDDKLYNFTFDFVAKKWQGGELALSTRRLLKSEQAIIRNSQSVRAVLSSGTSDGCKKGCFCHCVPEEPEPGRGCGCKKDCTKCKLDCGKSCKCGQKKVPPPPKINSEDPNEMVGPAGVGEERLVKPGEPMDYTIYFENQTNATAAAQDVYVTLPKDAGLDWSTFELGEVVFGDNIDTKLSGSYDGESTYALPGTNWSVRTVVTHTDDAVKWHLRIVDPTTPDNYPSDPYAGFLPPNDETGRGEGHLRYRVKVKDGATPGSVITASAVIEFDPLNGNKPIETDPAWWNTVGSPGAAFAESEAEANEGEMATIKIMGGSADAAASVK
ncbi:MAG: hypothetical protein IKQ17_03930, partial [Kiritimatiellae bacterium]|nr:hypothetical protein [Kiritimatiellia bacterium]